MHKPAFDVRRARCCARGLAVILLALLPLSLAATPPEVTGVRFDSRDELTWDPVPGASGQHVYRAGLAELPDYGACLLGSVQGTSAQVLENPPPGEGFAFLLSAFDEVGEGSLGSDSASNPRLPTDPCVPARRFFDLVSNGDPGDGVEDGVEPRRNPSMTIWAPGQRVIGDTVYMDSNYEGTWTGNQAHGGDGFAAGPGDWAAGVYLHTGEFFLRTTDVDIPGRQDGVSNTIMISEGDPSLIGLAIGSLSRTGNNDSAGGDATRPFASVYFSNGRINRVHRSQVSYDGPFGFGWDSNINCRLSPVGSDVEFYDGTGRGEVFLRVDSTRFDSPVGLYAKLREQADGSFHLRFPDGTIYRFHAFDGSNLEGAIESIEDRNGNLQTFQYDHQGLLTGITETLGREISIAYTAEGRVATITDFAGRTWTYGYSLQGDLTSVTTPAVTGTPNGNDFASGKTTSYTYSNGFADPELNHNLLTVVRPAEQSSRVPAIQNTYCEDAAQFCFDRLTAQTIGGTNGSGVAAGGTRTFAYTQATGAGRTVSVSDRNGNQKDYEHDQAGHCTRRVEFTNREVRPGETDYVTDHSYNADGELTEIVHPEQNRTLYLWDDAATDRFRQGNLLEIREVAGPRGDGLGGPINDIVHTFTREKIFNRISSTTEPRGNDPGYVPQNGGTWSAARYTTRWTFDYEEGDPATNGIAQLVSDWEIDDAGARANLGDRNTDGRTDQAAGNVVKLDSPTVRLDPASNQAAIQGDTTQEIAWLFRWNDFGQPIATVDPEENVHEYDYYPENDPDGDGSPTPAPADGRSLDSITGGYPRSLRTDTTSSPGRNNATNPTPTDIRTDYSYDDVGNVLAIVDGRGVKTSYFVNQLDQIVEVRRASATADASGPGGDPPTGRGETGLQAFDYTTRYEFDANDDVTAVRREDRNLDRAVGGFVDTLYTHDILGNLVRVEQEATSTESLVTEFRLDANENLIQVIQPEGNEHSIEYDERDLLFRTTRGASGPRGGTPAQRTYDWDGNRSLSHLTDGRGNPIDHAYDGFDRRVESTDQVGNKTRYTYDPRGNLVGMLRRGPVGGPTPPDRTGATNTDLSNVQFKLDELSRVFRVDRALFVPTGASPGRTPVLDEGPAVPGDGLINTVHEHDRLSRPTFLVRDSGVSWRTDYDGAGRRTKTTAPDGSTVEEFHDEDHNTIEIVEGELSSSTGPPAEEFVTTSFHDSLNRLTSRVDNIGRTVRYEYSSLDDVILSTDPNGPPGGMINRRSPGRTATTVGINGHGNVTERAYDGAGRLLSEEVILTASGQGNGTISPPPDTTNPYNTDGRVKVQFHWDRNSLPGSFEDDRGNATSYAHDNLNRPIQVTNADGTTRITTWDSEDNATQVTDPNGSVFTNSYDPANRPVQVDVVRATGVVGATQETREFDGRHFLTRATHDNDPADLTDDSEVEIVLDSLGRTIEEKQALGSGATATKLVDFDWLAADLMTGLTYPSGRKIEYAYGPADRLATVMDADPTRSESADFNWFGYTRLHTRTYDTGLRATTLDDAGTANTGFDGARRVTELRHLDPGNNLRAGFQYSYDGVNRLSERRPHSAPATGGDPEGDVWSYNSANWRVGFERGPLDGNHQPSGPATDNETWTHDGVANWNEMTRNGNACASTPNEMNEYDESGPGDDVPDDFCDDTATPEADGLDHDHDDNGNTTDEGNFEIAYDSWNRPCQVTRKSDARRVADYSWDAFGRMARREVTNSGSLDETQRYLYTPASPLGFRADTGGAQAVNWECEWEAAKTLLACTKFWKCGMAQARYSCKCHPPGGKPWYCP